jgi:hypothetical protein
MVMASEVSDELRVELAAQYVREKFESREPWSMTIARAILAERKRCEEENSRMRHALERCSALIDNYYFEGDKEYQVVLIASAALSEGER